MDKVRLGGMALQNGVLVHGPTSWAAAVRDDAGHVHVASGVKRRLAPGIATPVVRGPLRLAEAFAVLPDVRRTLPQARFPFERPAVACAVVAGSALAATARRSSRSALTREAVAALASLAPAVLALRGGQLASYHGAEHVSIGSYERDGEAAPKEHDRCGSHLIGPLLASSAVAGAIAARAPRRARGVARIAGAIGAVGVSVGCSPGWDATRTTAWPGRSPGRATSSSAVSRPPSPPRSSSRWPSALWRPASRPRPRTRPRDRAVASPRRAAGP
jgi:hypothetical protein